MHNETPNCARCPYKASDSFCRTEDGKSPGFCPTRNIPELVEQSLKEYNNNLGICEFAKQASIQEADGYMNRDLGYELVRASKTRIEEIMGFAEKMNYKRLGMAFCIGLRKEAKVVEKLFHQKGLTWFQRSAKWVESPRNTSESEKISRSFRTRQRPCAIRSCRP
jgi:uncharacterized metal-binding protein